MARKRESSRTRMARIRAGMTKAKTKKAASFSGLFKATVKGLPAAEKKIARKILSPFRRAWTQNLREYRKRYSPATSKQIKTMKRFKRK